MKRNIRINRQLSIPERELRFRFSRSSGPGGQNVNKVNTKVTLSFDVDRSPSLSAEQKRQIKEKLANRITHKGILMISAGFHRTQKANRDAAVNRFAQLIAWALKKPAPRKKTYISRSANERRLRQKKKRSMIKKERGRKFNREW